ncbi:RHS repeat-associated core domain-containing protein [Flavobacterium sp.]|uniref:RHS repeat-associated core domain-containing protein n=2 Tax=Flavobacterium sp. TaxID=239 RepID=UPI0040480FCE
MNKLNIFLVLFISFSQFVFSQDENIELIYDTSGYQSSNVNLTQRIDSSPNDTIPSIKGDMNVNESGGLTYMLPVEVFKGINNFQPNIALGYNSQAGNGQAGWGWNILGLSQISRGGKSKHIDGITIGRQFNDQDPFYLDGQRLIQISSTTYETEKYSKIKITKNASGSEYSFIVQYTDGKVAKYKELINGEHYISVILDNLDNQIHYSYSVLGNVPILNSISYGSNAISTDKFSIEFFYINRQQDIKLYRNGIAYISSKVLSEIKVKSSYLTSNGGLFRKYKLFYDYIQGNTVERLIKVEIENETGNKLKPLQFGYNQSNSATVELKGRSTNFPPIFGNYVPSAPNGGFSVPVGLGDVTVGDFHGIGDLTTIYEVKYSNDLYYIFNSKNKSFIETSNTSFKLYSGRALFDNKITENDALIYSKTEYIGSSTNTNNTSSLVDRITFKVKSLVPYKTKSFTLDLPGGLTQHQIPPHPYMFTTYSWQTNNDTITYYRRDEKERKILSGDFNNDALFDVFIIEHSNYTRSQKIYFYEIGKSSEGTITPLLVNAPSNLNADYDFYQIEFNGDGIPEFLMVNRDTGAYSVLKFDYLTLSLIPYSTGTLSNFTKKTPLLFGDYNGDGLTDFLTPQRIYDIDGSTAANELAKIQNESQLWWQYISTGTSFIKTQKDFTLQKIAYFKTSSRNIIKESSNWEKFWSGKPDSYEFTEYGTSGVIPVDFNNDGKTDLVSVNCFGTVKYNSEGNLLRTELLNPYSLSNNDKVVFYENKTLSNNENTFNIIATKQLGYSKISPLSLILNYNDFNNLNTYKSGLKIYDIALQRDFTILVNNDNFREGQISLVDNGSPVKQTVEYKPMVEKYNDDKEDVYTTTDLNLDAPFNVNRNLGTTYLVYKMHTVFDDNVLTKEYRYQNGIQHLDGKGFLGFQKTFISDPYESERINGKYRMKNLFTAHFWRINTYDPYLENSLKTSTYGSLNVNSIFTKSELTNQRFNNGNHRYQILTTHEINTDYLKNINITKSYEYDITNDLLLKQINTNYSSDGSSVEKFTYTPEFTNGEHYFFGKIIQSENITLRDGDSFSTKEVQTYDTNGSVSQIKKYGNGTIPIQHDFTYYPFGEIQTETISTIGFPNSTTQYEYDSTNRFLTKTILPDGLISEKNINILGRVLSETSTLGLTTNYSYDNWGNIKRITDYLGKKTFITKGITPTETNGYYSITSSQESGEQEIKIFDIFDRLIKAKAKTINDQWVVKEVEYDIFGKKLKESEPYFEGETPKWNETTYDYLDRPVKQTAYNGKIVTTCYEGMKVSVEDGHKKISKWLDAMGNVIKVEDGGGEIFYKYYPNGSLKETNYEGIKTTVEIDGWGNKTKLTDPSAGIYNYEYDNLNRLKKEINPKGGVTEYSYDNFGKILTENTNSPSENTIINKTYSYDPTTKLPTVINGTYNGKNYIYTTFYENTLHRVIGKKEETPDFTYETSVSYDSFGRIDETKLKTTLNNPSYVTISQVKNLYDPSGILTSQLDNQTGNVIWQLNNINPQGLTTQMHYGNGYTLQTDYSSEFYLQKIKHYNDSGNLLHIDFEYDNLKGVLNRRNNLTFGKDETYVYDALDRLLSETVNGIINKEYTYDQRGRMTSNTDIGKYNFNEQNYKLQSINFNTNGSNLNINRGFAQISYNSFKNPLEIHLANKDRISYDYSILKTRSTSYYGSLSTTATDRPNRKFYSSDKAIEIVKEGDNTKIITFITGDAYNANYMKVDILNNGSLVSNDNYFLHRDNQNTILAITKADVNGSVVEKRYFDAWGNLKEATIGTTTLITNELGWIGGLLIDRGYTGHEHLKTVGLIHMNGRIYDPILRRFMSPDNFVQDPHNTQSFNRYGYVFNNPLLYTDPTGELAFLAAVGIAAAVAIITNGISNSIQGVPFWYGAGRAGTMGAVAGAISFGIGSVATSTFTNAYSQAAFQAGMHATTGGIMSEIEGGSFASGFASGAVSSVVSSGIGFLGGNSSNPMSFSSRNPSLYKAIMISSGGLSGGIGSTIAGGDFWSGVRQGIITAGLNHLAHEGYKILKQEGLPKIKITVTDEIVGETKIRNKGKYYTTPLYKMTVSGTDFEGNQVSEDYEVVRFGIKNGKTVTLKAGDYTVSEFYYFQNGEIPALRIKGPYLFHLQSINGIDQNYGCIAIKGGYPTWNKFISTITNLGWNSNISEIASSLQIQVNIQYTNTPTLKETTR